MSNVVRLHERIEGLFAFFVEEGASVDGQTISSSVFPDASPTDNWPSIGTILEGAGFGTEERDDGYMAPSSAGGFEKVDSMITDQDFLEIQTRQMSGIVDRLLFGLNSAIVEGTAASPHVKKDRKITGWFLVQGRQQGGNASGADDFRLMWWVDIRLAEKPKYENKALSPKLKVIKKINALNSVVFPAAA